jgi:hypothetical protein
LCLHHAFTGTVPAYQVAKISCASSALERAPWSLGLPRLHTTKKRQMCLVLNDVPKISLLICNSGRDSGEYALSVFVPNFEKRAQATTQNFRKPLNEPHRRLPKTKYRSCPWDSLRTGNKTNHQLPRALLPLINPPGHRYREQAVPTSVLPFPQRESRRARGHPASRSI